MIMYKNTRNIIGTQNIKLSFEKKFDFSCLTFSVVFSLTRISVKEAPADIEFWAISRMFNDNSRITLSSYILQGYREHRLL